MQLKNRSSLYVGGSVLLIMLAIAATAVVNQTQNGGRSSEDIRAKAGVTSSLRTTGVVSMVDNNSGQLVVNNLRFVESNGEISAKDLGSWTVTPPPGFNPADVGVGVKLTITINPSTFLTTYHTLTATQIIIEK